MRTKYQETLDGITAGEELKEETVQKLRSARHAAEQADVRQSKKARRFGSGFWKAATAVYLSAALVFCAVFIPLFQFFNGKPTDGDLPADPPANEPAASRVYSAKKDEIAGLIRASSAFDKNGNIYGGVPRGDAVQDAIQEELESAESLNEAAAGGDYAKTNVQTEGVDEGDIIKADGGYIYKLSSAGLAIVSVKNGLQVMSKIDYENFVPVELFTLGDRLIVIGGVYETYQYTGPMEMFENEAGALVETIDLCIDYYGYLTYVTTRVIVYDMADRAELKELDAYEFSGQFITSRLIGDKLTVVVSHYVYTDDEDTFFPTVNGQEIDAENIYVYETNEIYCYYNNYLVTASVDLKTNNFTYKAHLGLYGYETMYVSAEYLYVFNTDYSKQTFETQTVPYSYTNPRTGEVISYQNEIITKQIGNVKSRIFKISLATLICGATGTVDGRIDNRYYADEYEGNLRVVSYVDYYSYTFTPGQFYSNAVNKSYTAVHVLDKNLVVLGKITDIAVGERIYSARFNKLEGSIVTFMQIDPLFKLDLSDPYNPKISDGLKEPGVSNYLQYLSDDVILGLGQNQVGNSFRGIKVSLYDNTGKEAVNVNTQVIGGDYGYAYSEALYNPKAILNDTANHLFAIPVECWSYTEYGAAEQGLAVFTYDLTAPLDADKLTFRGILSNTGKNVSYQDWYAYYDAGHNYVTRGARIGDTVYTISDRYITGYDLATLTQTDKVEIASFPTAGELFGK